MYKKFLTKKYIILLVIILVIAVSVGGFFLFRDNSVDYEYSVVEKGDLVQEVNVTGKVKPASKVDLAFETSGRVVGVYADVGKRVYAGQTLAVLNSSQYQAQYLQAQASLDAEIAKLAELQKGTRLEEIEIQKTKVLNAEESVTDAKSNLKNYIRDSYTKSDDSVRNKVDQFFTNPRSFTPQLNFESSYKLEMETQRFFIESVLVKWFESISVSDMTDSEIDNQFNLAKDSLGKIGSFLDLTALTVNSLNTTSSLTQAQIDGYRLDINTARTNINTAVNNLLTAKEKLRTAESNLLLAKQELTLKSAGATAEQILAQEARVKSAEANVNNYSALIAKNVISSPINGVVTKKNIEVGEIVQPNVPAFSVISTSKYEIETNVPEADVSKIKVGNKAKITLDAYEDDEIFYAHIISIEPAETIIEGVSAYKTALQFDKEDEKIKSGMTANMDIMTDSREGVLFIPFRALITEGGKFVEVLNDDGTIEKKTVETGMRSSDGRIEIVSGLKEGEKVVTSK
ncbi:MAG: efflux RND transporter periplasmic adaptor subunit [Candidatus Pacebacteria bacterium]|nr:efflux RND transporter periplasmic adaptor subunit [Candidatus Paceibacterota bacterium]